MLPLFMVVAYFLLGNMAQIVFKSTDLLDAQLETLKILWTLIFFLERVLSGSSSLEEISV